MDLDERPKPVYNSPAEIPGWVERQDPNKWRAASLAEDGRWYSWLAYKSEASARRSYQRQIARQDVKVALLFHGATEVERHNK